MTSGNATPDASGGRYETRYCNVKVTPASILAGGEATVDYYAYSSNQRITYTCGDAGEVSAGTGGLFQDNRICRFSTPGSVTVWVALDGQICASAPLEVVKYGDLGTPAHSCAVLSNTQSSGTADGLRTYAAKVQFRNYPPNATLDWDCRWKKFSKSMSTFSAGPLVSGIATLNCQYSFDPGPITSLPVWAGGDFCGDLLAPSN